MPDKTITQKVVTANEVDRLTVEVVGGVPTVIATYHVVDGTGATIGHQRQVSVALPPAPRTTLQTFVTNIVLPAVNAAEGT
jgi:hypothetical protein